MTTIADHEPNAANRLEREVYGLQAMNGELADQCAFLRHMANSQARIIELQMERIDLLQHAARPLGPRGQARLHRSPWWRRASRRIIALFG